MELENMTDEELQKYKEIKQRIKSLEARLEFLESDIPTRIVRQKIESTRLTLQANTNMLYFLFGENQLKH